MENCKVVCFTALLLFLNSFHWFQHFVYNVYNFLEEGRDINFAV